MAILTGSMMRHPHGTVMPNQGIPRRGQPLHQFIRKAGTCPVLEDAENGLLYTTPNWDTYLFMAIEAGGIL